MRVSPAYEAKGFTNYDRLPGTISDWRANAYAEFGKGIHNIRADMTFVDRAIDNRAPIGIQNAAGIDRTGRPTRIGRPIPARHRLGLALKASQGFPCGAFFHGRGLGATVPHSARLGGVDASVQIFERWARSEPRSVWPFD